MRDVGLDGCVADVELASDLDIREAACDQAKHVELALGQIVECLWAGDMWKTGELFDHPLRDGRREKAAAYGVLVLVFQNGFVLGFSSTTGIDPVVPLLLFVILFGLSMDYHVFIISRIRDPPRPRRSHRGRPSEKLT